MGARPKNSSPDWWYDDVSCLSLPLYKRLISAMEYRGVSQDITVGSLDHYAKGRLPGLNRRKSISDVSNCLSMTTLTPLPSEEEQKYLLEEIDRLLPFPKGCYILPSTVWPSAHSDHPESRPILRVQLGETDRYAARQGRCGRSSDTKHF
jgi:hypothetical protein